MDIRDVHFNVNDYPGSLALPVNIFDGLIFQQKALLEHYQKIEKLPLYPINIHTKEGQALIKDFSARIIEELGEAMESYYLAAHKIRHGHSPKVAHNDIINFNEELADALHFFLELLIYSDILHFKPFILRKLESMGIQNISFLSSDPITSLYQVAEKELSGLREDTKVLKIKIPLDYLNLMPGGNSFSDKFTIRMERNLWKITYNLQLARNTLKNKPWKQTELLTDQELYMLYISEAFYSLILFFLRVGINPWPLFIIYSLKNKVNSFRIRSNY